MKTVRIAASLGFLLAAFTATSVRAGEPKTLWKQAIVAAGPNRRVAVKNLITNTESNEEKLFCLCEKVHGGSTWSDVEITLLTPTDGLLLAKQDFICTAHSNQKLAWLKTAN